MPGAVGEMAEAKAGGIDWGEEEESNLRIA